MERQLEVMKLILHSPRTAEQLCGETGFSPASVEFCLGALLEMELIEAVPDEGFLPAVNYYYPKLGWWYGKPWNT